MNIQISVVNSEILFAKKCCTKIIRYWTNLFNIVFVLKFNYNKTGMLIMYIVSCVDFITEISSIFKIIFL